MGPQKRTGSLFELLGALIRACLPDVLENDLLELLSQRVSDPKWREELLGFDWVSDALHEKDQKEFERERIVVSNHLDECAAFAKEWQTKKRATVDKAARKNMIATLKTRRAISTHRRCLEAP